MQYINDAKTICFCRKTGTTKKQKKRKGAQNEVLRKKVLKNHRFYVQNQSLVNFDEFLDFKKQYKKLSNFDDFEPLGGPRSQKTNKFLLFLMIWNLPADQADQVSFATVRDLPSTRAGGQDDVSSKQTPSNYINILLYIQIIIYFCRFCTSSVLPLKQGEFHNFSLRDPILASLLNPFDPFLARNNQKT